MKNLTYKRKSIIMAFISGILLIAIFITTYALIRSLNNEQHLENLKEKETKIYGVVNEVGDNYIKINSIEDEEILINTNHTYQEGDFVAITYNEDEMKSITPNAIDVIASKEEIEIKKTTTTTTKSIYRSTTSAIKTTLATTKKINEEEIVAYALEQYKKIDEYYEEKDIPKKVKDGVVTLIDFIFYKGTIKGVTFDAISNSAKAKILYNTLLIDDKMNAKWPNYKENIKNETTNLKEKMLAKYMDLTSSICENKEKECLQTKEDFKLLKTSLNLTWEFLKSTFKYGYNKTLTYLKNWYEVWREKE